jgi:glycosyltransferase involved in cell wall biosynthesis
MRKKTIMKVGGGYRIGEMALSRKTWFGQLKLRLLAWAHPIVVVVNQGQFQELEESGLGHLKTVLIPNGVNLKRFHPVSVSEKETLRYQFGLSGLVFLFVGRFSADKLRLDIFDRFLEAWSRFIKKERNANFYLVGSGPLETEYRQMIDQRRLSASVHILGPREDVATLYQSADFFVLPSITEGLSNALLEAMACGLPVVGSRVPGIIDIVEEGHQGFLFDPQNVSEIEQALYLTLNNSNLLKSLSSSCIETARKYSIDATVDQTLQLYREKVG